jgi:hypothetical protein
MGRAGAQITTAWSERCSATASPNKGRFHCRSPIFSLRLRSLRLRSLRRATGMMLASMDSGIQWLLRSHRQGTASALLSTARQMFAPRGLQRPSGMMGEFKTRARSFHDRRPVWTAKSSVPGLIRVPDTRAFGRNAKPTPGADCEAASPGRAATFVRRPRRQPC